MVRDLWIKELKYKFHGVPREIVEHSIISKKSSKIVLANRIVMAKKLIDSCIDDKYLELEKTHGGLLTTSKGDRLIEKDFWLKNQVVAVILGGAGVLIIQLILKYIFHVSL